MSEPPRRSQRSQPSKKDEAAKEEHELDEDAIEEDEEVTRCVCGLSEYPGPALSEAFDGVDAQAEDAGGLFISCDACKKYPGGTCSAALRSIAVMLSWNLAQLIGALHLFYPIPSK